MAFTASTVLQEITYGNRQAVVRGTAAFTTTNLTGSIDCKLTRVLGARIWAANAPGTATEKFKVAIGTLSATGTKNIIFPRTGTVTAVKAVVGTTVTTSDTDFWTFTFPNKSAADAAIIAASNANTTKVTGGSALTAYTARSFTLGAGVAVTADDVGLFTATKSASGANLVDLALQLEYTASSVGEFLYVNETYTDGEIAPTNGLLNFARTGPTVTSALKVCFEYWGY